MPAHAVRRYRGSVLPRAPRQAPLSRDPRVLHASRAGALAAGALRGEARLRVASVQRRAVHLALDDGTRVTLLPEGTPVHPWAVTAAFDPALLAVGAGTRAAADEPSEHALRIEIGEAEVVELRLHRRAAGLPSGESRRLARLAGPAARQDPFERALGEALAAFEAGGGVGGLLPLIGLGPGLTPAGDDALVGLLAGLDAGRDLAPGAATLRGALVAALPERLAERTTRLSAQLLAAAAAGLYAEPVLGVLESLGAEDSEPGAVEGSARALIAVGHRTGTVILRGIAAALARLAPA